MTILVTGGAGFIGSTFVHNWIETKKTPVITLDKLTYAGHKSNLESLARNPLHTFIKGDIGDRKFLQAFFKSHQPSQIIHFAAESHVDRSIRSPEVFIQTNIVGTSILLEEAYTYWKRLSKEDQTNFRFLHLSTDEVYGSLSHQSAPLKEGSVYAPNSPYAASKASADHLVRAYYQTYQFPTLTALSSNNFGPRQYPEKLIPLTIVHALSGKKIPIYGNGLQKRDWLYVEEHCNALRFVLEKGRIGESYHIASGSEQTNLDIVKTVCRHLDNLRPNSQPYADLIAHVEDRPGHDFRYSLSTEKIQKELGWSISSPFENQLHNTVKWYLDNPDWLHEVSSKGYKNWLKIQYNEDEEC